MAQVQSFNTKNTTHSFGVFQLLRQLGSSILAITALLILAGIIIGLSGCTKAKSGNEKTATASNQSSQLPAAVTPPVTTSAKPATAAKKKPVAGKTRTVAYSSSAYEVSFRFPGEYNLTTPGHDDQTSLLVEGVPTNFVQPGGVTLATIELPKGSSTSFFSVSANKMLTSDQCQQFAVPDASDMAGNSPVDSNDSSIPSKAKIHEVEFSRVENATEQEDVKYYHHFEPNHDGSGGTCYEFAMGVEEAKVTSKTLDYIELFDQLDRIMDTVKINSESAPAVATTVPASQPSSSNPQ